MIAGVKGETRIHVSRNAMNLSKSFPLGTMLGKVLRYPLPFVRPGMEVRFLQGALRGKKWLAGTMGRGVWLGTFEYEKRRLFEKTVRPGDVVFDVGACVGFYSLLASVLVGKTGRVFAFEPLPANIRDLNEHLKRNKITNVTVIQSAVSDAAGFALFNPGPDRSMGHLSAQGTLAVKTVSLDAMVEEGNCPAPDHIKIDVEGSEMPVLRGAVSLLAHRRPALYVATHGSEIHGEVLRFLRSLGYVVTPIRGESLEQTDELFAEDPYRAKTVNG